MDTKITVYSYFTILALGVWNVISDYSRVQATVYAQITVGQRVLISHDQKQGKRKTVSWPRGKCPPVIPIIQLGLTYGAA